MKKLISLFLNVLFISTTFFGYLLYIPQVNATGPTGLNQAPVITSTNFTVAEGDSIIGTVLATDQDNVVMEYGATTVTGNTWKNITHSEMCNPVVVSSARSDVNGETQRVVRVRDKGLSDFDIKVDNQGSSVPANANTPVDWIVVNAGAQDFIDDNNNTFHIQAGSESVSSIFGNSCRVNDSTTEVTFNPAFSSDPSVIHSISSNNGASSIASSVVGNTGSFSSDPSTTKMGLLMQVAFGSCTHVPEDVDYLATDNGHFVFGGVEIDAVKSTDTIAAVTNTGNPVTFTEPFSSVPQTIITSMMGIDGANGGHGVVHTQGTVTTSTFPASVDEDGNTARTHTTEPFGALAFENDSGKITQPVQFTYSISGGADASSFLIDSATGELSANGALIGDDFEVEVEVCDDHCNSKCSNQTITVDILNSPTDITLSNNSADENIIAGSTIGTFSTVDLDPGDTHTYTLVSGAGDTDNAAFSILGNTLSINISPDFEFQSSYSVRVETDDGNGGTYEEVFTININDLDEVAPVITLTGSDPVSVVKNGNYTDAGATCTDDVDVSCSVIVGGATVDTSTLGSYIITYNATDIAGNNASQVTRTVNVVAGNAPVITRIGGPSINVEVLSTYIDAGATASDAEDGDISSDIVTVNPVDTTTLGAYIVSYDVDDSSDNSAIQATRIVNVVDTNPPVISLVGSSPINVIRNASYNDAGATAADSFDGDITTDIVIVNPVDTTTLGTYIISYNVSDSSSNAASQVTRTVNVIAGDTPVITLIGSNPITHEVNTSYTDAGATATDSEDGDISSDIVTVNPVDDTSLGSYIVEYNVNDSSGNAANQVNRTVNVVDTTGPIISLIGSDLITLTQGENYSDAGATCSDNFDVSCSVIVSGDTVDPTRVGTYLIRYNAVDTSGNNAIQLTRVVNITPAALLINEVEYDTPGNEAEAEWFEIHNPTSGAVNIENWTITEAVGTTSNKTYTFGDVEIPAGGYLIVTNETADFNLVYPGVIPDVDLPGTQFFNLKNSPSDELELRDPDGNSIDFVRWEDVAGGWDLEATDAPICRLLVPDTDTDADWSDQCIPTPGAINQFNAIPTDIVLSSENIDENNAASATVGILTTADADAGDTHTYSLVSGAGDSDNASFTISGNSLIITPVADYEVQQSYAIRLQTDDGNGGIYQEEFIININDINLAPTDIALSVTNIDENNSAGDTIGVLSGVDDGEDTNTLTFALACDTPGADDASFAISGSNLNAAGIYDFEVQSVYNICIQVSDGVLTYDENFIININDLDEVNPVVIITPVTKLQNSSITDTTIQITDDVGVNVADISIDVSTTATTSALNCTQTSTTQVDCTISVDTSGDLVISALDTSANLGSDTETNYVIDITPPNVPNVSVDTLGSFSVDSPELTFSSLDNVGVDFFTVTYSLDDGSPTGTGTLTTINPATSPVVLSLDPQEPIVHTIIVTVFDEAGNSSSTTIKFPPIITFNAPTTLSNTTITDSTVSISTPTGNAITNIQLAPGTTGATLGTCTGTGGGTTDPFISPVICDINSISDSGTITVTADDNIIAASGINSQSYVIDTVAPVVTITAPIKLDNVIITDTSVVVTDDTAVDVVDISVAGSSSVTSSLFSCIQTSITRVDCTISIDDSGDLTISADDLAGNNATQTEPNYIIDTIPPVIALIAPSPETVEYLSVYTDGLAEFNDNVDGTGSLVGAGSVNTGILGSYVLSYDYTDTAGNPATQVTRTVNVVDTTPPVITITGNATQTVEVNTSYTDAGATAVDNFDGNLTSSIVTVNGVDINTVGSYIVRYDVTDSNTNVATQVTRMVNVVDTTPPVITLTGLDEVVLEVGTAYTEPGATATDNEDTILPANIVIDSSAVNTNLIGSYDVSYNVSDTSGNPAVELVRTVTIEDTTLPVITLTGNATETVEVNTPYTDAGATATDNFDGTITGNITTINPVDINTLGSYTITYAVIDSSGNAATQVIRTVNVVDTTLPVITLTGNATEKVEVNTSYTDAGATATDNFDGNLTPDIVVTNPVDTTTLGTYIVSYDVTDSSTNQAIQVTRSINVVDTTPPVINLTGSSPLTIFKNAPYIEFGALCNDNFDTTCAVLIGGDTVDTTTLGTYTITYNATDTNSNVATQVTRTVNVRAGDTPLITLRGNATQTVEVNTSYIDAGATATDTEDGNISSNLTIVNPVDITAIGTYTISYNVTDSSDNIATQITRSVNVVDTTPPVINLTGSGVINVFRNATYTEPGAVCADNFDATCSVVVGGDSVDTTTLGTYTITYNVTDLSGNAATQVTRTVNIVAGDIPVITLTGSGVLTHEVNTPYIDAGATASDTEDGNITASIVIDNGVDITSTGSYVVTYDVEDFSDNSATQLTRTVNVVDTTPPVITLSGNATETVNLGDAYTDAGATCIDNFDTSCTVVVDNPVDVNTLGSYIVTYDATDITGNSATQITRTVEVVTGDTPVITLIGNTTQTVEVNTSYLDAGAVAADTEDGNISSLIVINNPVDTSILASYIVTYSVTDSNNNSATELTRTVNVVDTTPPVITLSGNATETVNLGDTYTDAGATCVDNFDLTCTLVVDNPVDVNTLGSYSVTYDTTDITGNSAIQITRIVNVVSGDAPVITLSGATNISIFKNTPYIDAGATALDSEDGDISSNIQVVNPVDINTIGSYSVTYDVEDSNLNSATQVFRTVNIISGDIPVISLLGSNPSFIQKDSLYTDAGATASDTEQGDLTSDIIVDTMVDTSTLGTYSVRYDVRDISDNDAMSVFRTVIVIDALSDTDGDSIPDEIELLIGTNPNSIDTDNDGTSDINNDLDNISPFIELGAINNGDGNDDGILDASQNSVSSLPNIRNNGYNTMEIANPEDSCSQIQFFDSKRESNLSVADTDFRYDLGLWDFEIGCSTPGATANIKIYLDRVYDTTSWNYRKYDENTQIYTDISDIVSYTTQTVGTTPVTVIAYSITDGGIYDEDGLENGLIIDPSGPGIDDPFTGTPGSAGGRTYVCRDIRADNYSTDGFSDPELCEYSLAVNDPVQDDELTDDIVDDIVIDETQNISEEIPEESDNTLGDEPEDIIEEFVSELGQDYILKNNFASCSIISDIQNPLYQFSQDRFSDISLNPQRSDILKFAQIGIVDGYEDGSFGPQREMTRSEFLKVALISHCYEYQNQDTSSLPYTDVEKQSWQARVITKAQSLGMINGDVDALGNPIFRPDDIISKAEAVKILMRLSLIDVNNPVILGYTDVTTSWQEKYIITGETLGLFDSQSDNGRFYPDLGVQRSSMIDLIDRLIQFYK